MKLSLYKLPLIYLVINVTNFFRYSIHDHYIPEEIYAQLSLYGKIYFCVTLLFCEKLKKIHLRLFFSITLMLVYFLVKKQLEPEDLNHLIEIQDCMM